MAFLSAATSGEGEVDVETEDEVEADPLPEVDTVGDEVAAIAAPEPMSPQRAETVPATVIERNGFIVLVFIVASLAVKILWMGHDGPCRRTSVRDSRFRLLDEAVLPERFQHAVRIAHPQYD